MRKRNCCKVFKTAQQYLKTPQQNFEDNQISKFFWWGVAKFTQKITKKGSIDLNLSKVIGQLL